VNLRANSPKRLLITTEIYQKRLTKFFSDNGALADAQIIMGVNALRALEDPAILAEIRARSSEESMWPLGAVCCGLAHFEAISVCIESNEPVTIFEDDAVLVGNFDEKSKALIDEVGTEWDLIQWGYNWDSYLDIRYPEKNGPVFRVGLLSEKEKFSEETFRNSNVNSKLFPLVSTFGMHAYTISPKGAKKLLQHYPRITDIYIDNINLLNQGYWALSLDMVLNSFYDKNECYVALPPLSYVVNDKQASVIWNPNYKSEYEE
jgi:GR25 family glycosyltransferase involved in LPS biosynthesis